eukprot:Gb_17495 [translate_table: standard]
MKGAWYSTPPVSPTASPTRGRLDLRSSASPPPQGGLCKTLPHPQWGLLASHVQAQSHPQGDFWSYVPQHCLVLKGTFGLTGQTISIMLNGHVLHLLGYCLLTVVLWPTNQPNKIFPPEQRKYKVLTNVGALFDVEMAVAFILASRLLVNSSNSQPTPYR